MSILIDVKNSVPNTFQTDQDITDDDLDATRTTVGNTTGKLPNSGTSKIKLTNNKLFQCFRFPRREALSFLFCPAQLYNNFVKDNFTYI